MTSPSLSTFWRREFAAGGPPPTWVLAQPVAGVLAWAAVRARISASQVTLAGLLLALAGAWVLATGEAGFASQFGAWCLLTFAYLLDCADGQVARATQTTSERGGWLDVYCDYVVIGIVPFAALWYHVDSGADPGQILWLLAGALAMIVGRSQDLFTASMFRKASKERFSTAGVLHLARRSAVSLTDTLTVSLLVCVLRDSIMLLTVAFFVLGGLGTAHSTYIALRRFNAAG